MISVNQLKYKLLTSAFTVLLMSSCGGGAGSSDSNNSGFTNNATNTKPQISSSESSTSSVNLSTPETSTSHSSLATSVASSLSSSSLSTSKASSSTSSSRSSAKSSTVVITDKIAPTTPANFSADIILSDQVRLKWSPATDNVGVAFYTIYRDQVQISTLLSSDTGTYDFDVAPNRTYIYSISATDGAGNWSALNSIDVTTLAAGASSSSKQSSSSANSSGNTSSSAKPDTTLPAAPAQVIKVNALSSQVDISWTAATDNIGVTSYKVYRDNILLSTLPASTLSYSDKTASPKTNYWYGVAAGDAAGNWSAQSFVNVTTPQPITSGNVTLKWQPPTQRENGTTLLSTEIGGYSVRYRLATDTVYTYLPADKNQTQITINNLIGDYVFSIAVYDVNNLYSNFTNITPQ